jgi:hypothetical protein
MKELNLRVEELEARIAPSVNGTGGYDGQPGNQSNAPDPRTAGRSRTPMACPAGPRLIPCA